MQSLPRNASRQVVRSRQQRGHSEFALRRNSDLKLIRLIAIEPVTQAGYSLALGLTCFTGISLTEVEVLDSPSEVVSQKPDTIPGSVGIARP